MTDLQLSRGGDSNDAERQITAATQRDQLIHTGHGAQLKGWAALQAEQAAAVSSRHLDQLRP